jgi:nitrite reductase/ring-hydroxylating ferredoxin subunit
MPSLIKITESNRLAPGQAEAFEVEGKRIAVFNVDGNYYAIDDTCPHADSPLSGGCVDQKRLTVSCPWHGAEFDLQTGAVLCAPARGNVGAYKVVLEGDDLKVEI